MSPAPSSSAPGRIGVGMSGGLDSTVVAALLRDQGHDVMGLTLHMFKEGSRCCSIEDIDRARRICDLLEIPHATVNVVDYFRETIIEPFVDAYARGRTPSPCVLCNEYVKFGALHTRARQLGCSQVATGHYVRVEHRDGAFHLMRAADRKKDQSYFLHRLSQEQLARSLFPLATWEKPDVAAYARDHDLPVSTSPTSESQDLCFVSNDGHGALVEQMRPDLQGRTGPVINRSGEPLGEHPGVHHFTIGQRKGIRVPAATRLYVREIDAAANQLVVGTREEMFDRTCSVSDVHWISGAPPAEEFECEARVRYRTPSAAATARVDGTGRVTLVLREPQFAITRGQAAVLYDGEEILGGGWIDDVE